MKRVLLGIGLTCLLVFGFTSAAFADHSPGFYFDFQEGSGMMNNTAFQAVFPPSWNTSVTAEIDNETSPHGGYSQSTAKCGVCHAIHRAPTLSTSNFGSKDAGTGTTSSRYQASPWAAEADTQMLLRSTVSRACVYCHVVNGPNKMFGGDPTYALVGDTALGWGQFYGHTTNCPQCHSVHGADCLQGSGVTGLILKYRGVKNLGTIALKVQPEVYGSDGVADKPASYGSLYTSYSNMVAGTLSSTAIAAGVTPKAAAITAQCTICHASYAVGEETINANYMNAELFQPATWASANGSTAKIFVGNSTNPVSALPGIAGYTYTGGTPSAITGSAGSLIMAYKNHPMNAGNAGFNGAGASALFGNAITAGNPIKISVAGASTCQSCHDAPESVSDGQYLIDSFPHYTPGYYKFMTAQNQAAFDTPSTLAQFSAGRQAFYSNGGKPAVMNDGYCIKCHDKVGVDW